MNTQGLKGKLILDCSILLPGPFTARLLAEQGARVVKVENPNRPDPSRLMGVFHAELNRGKEIVWMDITTQNGRSEFEDWVRRADGLVQGFRPEASRRLGLDADTLQRINPELCVLNLAGWPPEDPRAQTAGHDMNFAAVTGALSLFNGMPGLPLADLFASWHGALCLASALAGQKRGERGARIVVTLSEALLEAQGLLIAQYRADGIVPRPGGTLFSGLHPCYRIYRSRDGRGIAVGALEPKFWRKVCEIAGTPQLIECGLTTGAEAEAAAAELQESLGSRDWSDWAPLFAAADCCVEPVLDYSEVYPRSAEKQEI